MNYSSYLALHQRLVEEKSTTGVHDEVYIDYTRLNWQRMKRWNKVQALSVEQKKWLEEQDENAGIRWVVLTEPWCGDAAPSLPIMNQISEIHKGLSLEILLRDEHDSLMNQFLTNGSKSIPKLIQYRKDQVEFDAQWGPRPQGAAKIISDCKAIHGRIEATCREELQAWYNQDGGKQISEELLFILGRK